MVKIKGFPDKRRLKEYILTKPARDAKGTAIKRRRKRERETEGERESKKERNTGLE